MKHNVVAPSVGESITEVSILKWSRQSGELVKNGDLLLEIESDKATVEIVAEATGVLTQIKAAGDRVPVGEQIGIIDDAAKPTVTSSAPLAATASAPKAAAAQASQAAPQAAPQASSSSSSGQWQAVTDRSFDASLQNKSSSHATPAAAPAAQAPKPTFVEKYVERPGDRRVPMTLLRAKIAERLVAAQHNAALLTTFNEVDMSAINKIRSQHKDSFKAKNGVALSFMSFFTRASVLALKSIPEVNASIDGKDVIYHDYYDIGIAVGSDRGLVVPVIRGSDKLSFLEIEKKIAEVAVKARDGKLSIAEMSGGTFTISNGGTYGSLMSTPILNPPQSAILGMHKIMDRPMAVAGKIEIRPMMYLALSYDHRLIDGKGAVTFLVQLKDFLENPEKLGLDFI